MKRPWRGRLWEAAYFGVLGALLGLAALWGSTPRWLLRLDTWVFNRAFPPVPVSPEALAAGAKRLLEALQEKD